MELEIIYEDNHILVVKKPVGLLSQRDITNDKDMLTLLKDYIKRKYNKPGNVFLGLVHRLDRMVSGLMVFAKTSKAASRLSNQIRIHSFKKEYLAVVHGKTAKTETLVNYLLKEESSNTVKVVSQSSKGAKEAELSYNLIDFMNNLSLISINLKTGRPHQIRVQFKNIGHPLYGDKKYGNRDDKQNIALFASKLSFSHPTTKELLTFSIKPNNVYPFNLFQIVKSD